MNIDSLPPSINCILKQTQKIPCYRQFLASPIWREKTALGMSWRIGLNKVPCDFLDRILVSIGILDDNDRLWILFKIKPFRESEILEGELGKLHLGCSALFQSKDQGPFHIIFLFDFSELFIRFSETVSVILFDFPPIRSLKYGETFSRFEFVNFSLHMNCFNDPCWLSLHPASMHYGETFFSLWLLSIFHWTWIVWWSLLTFPNHPASSESMVKFFTLQRLSVFHCRWIVWWSL